MASEISESVELRLIDTAQLAAEQKKLLELKRIAREAESAKNQLSSGSSPAEFLGTAPDRMPGVISSDLRSQSRRGAITGGRSGSEFARLREQVRTNEKRTREQIRDAKKLKRELDEKIDRFADKLGFADGLLSGDVSGSLSGTLSRFGPIGSIIAAAVTSIAGEYFKQYQRGGIYSKTLKVAQDTLTINDIDEITSVKSGVKYITSDMRIAQRIPSDSNTSNLGYEHIRYVAEDNGR